MAAGLRFLNTAKKTISYNTLPEGYYEEDLTKSVASHYQFYSLPQEIETSRQDSSSYPKEVISIRNFKDRPFLCVRTTSYNSTNSTSGILKYPLTTKTEAKKSSPAIKTSTSLANGQTSTLNFFIADPQIVTSTEMKSVTGAFSYRESSSWTSSKQSTSTNTKIKILTATATAKASSTYKTTTSSTNNTSNTTLITSTKSTTSYCKTTRQTKTGAFTSYLGELHYVHVENALYTGDVAADNRQAESIASKNYTYFTAKSAKKFVVVSSKTGNVFDTDVASKTKVSDYKTATSSTWSGMPYSKLSSTDYKSMLYTISELFTLTNTAKTYESTTSVKTKYTSCGSFKANTTLTSTITVTNSYYGNATGTYSSSYSSSTQKEELKVSTYNTDVEVTISKLSWW